MHIRTLIADHGDLSIAGLRAILGEVPRVELVGEARDTTAMEAMLLRTKPHVVLMDHLSEGFGAEAIRKGLRRLPRARFVAITPDPSPLALLNALKAGVHSYVKKDCGAEEIVDAVLRTADGERFFCGKIVEVLRRADIDLANMLEAPQGCEPVVLSPREIEVIALIAEGCSYTRIAERLHLSAHTVTTHRRNIMQKLGVNNTAAVVMYAVKQGLVSPNKFLFNA